MDDMDAIDIGAFQADIARHLDRVERDRQELVVTREDHEPMVVMPLREWAGMQETLHLMSNPANAERLLASIREADAGNWEEHDLIEPGVK